MFVLEFKCKKCGENSKALPVIKEVIARRFENGGEKIYITEIECEKCGEKYIVQIDTDNTFAMLERQKRLNYDIGSKRFYYGSSNKKIKKIEERLNAVSSKLLKERDILSKTYNNLDYYENGKKTGTIKFENIITQIVNTEI